MDTKVFKIFEGFSKHGSNDSRKVAINMSAARKTHEETDKRLGIMSNFCPENYFPPQFRYIVAEAGEITITGDINHLTDTFPID